MILGITGLLMVVKVRHPLARLAICATAIGAIVLTTSKADEDVVRSYDLGVNSFITKPVTFLGLVEVMKVFSRYWMEIVDLPRKEGDE